MKILKSINDIFKDINMEFTIIDKFHTIDNLEKPFKLHHKTVNSIITTKKDTLTLYFNNIITINPKKNFIYINFIEIDPTINASGNIILNKYMEFGRLNKFKYIYLYDGSIKQYNTCDDALLFTIISLFVYGKTWYQSHGFEYESKIDYYNLNKDKRLTHFLSESDILNYKNALPDIITDRDITILNLIQNLNKLYLRTNIKMTEENCDLLNDLLLELTDKILPNERILYYYF
jgi:hypothetical protein